MKNKGKLVLKLILISGFIGLFIIFYQYVGHLVIDGSNYLLQGDVLAFILTVLLSLMLMIGLIYVNRLIPGYYGSGIPQIEAYYNEEYRFNPYNMLWLIIVNSYMAFFTGFLLGSEGPSISIGTSVSMIGNKLFKDEDKEIEACGGSAGFACAFMSPLAGLCHLIEENRRILSITLLLKGIVVIAISFIICYFIYPHNLLPFFECDYLPAKYYWLLVFVIALAIGFGKLYIILITWIKDLSKKYKIMIYLTPLLMIGFMLLRRFHPILVGNGSLLLEANIVDYSLIILFGLMLFRLIGTALSVSSNTSGGVVLPMLGVGALTSALLVKVCSFVDSNILEYSSIFIVCGMMTVFAVVTKAPLTAFVLGLKCMPLWIIALPLIITISISTIFVELFKWKNIYHELVERLVPKVDVSND